MPALAGSNADRTWLDLHFLHTFC